jgi:serine/threonine-protein kinase RsbW
VPRRLRRRVRGMLLSVAVIVQRAASDRNGRSGHSPNQTMPLGIPHLWTRLGSAVFGAIARVRFLDRATSKIRQDGSRGSLMATDQTLQLSFDARPENVPVARRAVTQFAGNLGMQGTALGDVMTVVTEACSNVVRHAYSEQPGTFEVEAFAAEGELVIVVRDHGEGVRPRIEAEPTTLKLGLGLIGALSRHFEISASPTGGTEVRMRLAFG